MEAVDEYFSRAVAGPPVHEVPRDIATPVVPDVLAALFAAQLQIRHLDLAARWLQSVGRGYYTIGSAGHESNAAVALPGGKNSAAKNGASVA